MATIYLKLSKRVQQKTQMSEIIIRLRNGKDYDLLVKSGIFITADNFKNGELVVNRRKVGNDVEYHEKMKDKLDRLEKHILNSVKGMGKEDVTKVWLVDLVDRFIHPEKYVSKEVVKKQTFYELAEVYLAQKQFSYDHTKGFRVLVRAVARYEGFRRYNEAAVEERRDLTKILTNEDKFTFDPDTLTSDDIEDFRDYLRNEKDLSEEYKRLYKRMLDNYPANIKSGYHEIEGRGENAVIKLMKKLKAFFGWLYETGRTTNRPFDRVKIGTEKYGTPYYITIDERNTIASTPMPTKHLEVQRDIFIFHCFVGCRVSDLMKLTERNITDGILEYLRYSILPIFCLSLNMVAGITRQTRTNMLDVINQDYIRTARANGISEKKVIFKHALKNALIPVITQIALQVRVVIGGSVIVEQIFNINGIGMLLRESIFNRDYMIVQTSVFFISLVTVFCNLVVDICYGFVNPQIRKSGW